jgi:hypothetical protein
VVLATAPATSGPKRCSLQASVTRLALVGGDRDAANERARRSDRARGTERVARVAAQHVDDVARAAPAAELVAAGPRDRCAAADAGRRDEAVDSRRPVVRLGLADGAVGGDRDRVDAVVAHPRHDPAAVRREGHGRRARGLAVDDDRLRERTAAAAVGHRDLAADAQVRRARPRVVGEQGVAAGVDGERRMARAAGVVARDGDWLRQCAARIAQRHGDAAVAARLVDAPRNA